MAAALENAEVVEMPLDEHIVLPSDEEEKEECLEAFSTEPQGPSSNRISDNDGENSAHVVADIMQLVTLVKSMMYLMTIKAAVILTPPHPCFQFLPRLMILVVMQKTLKMNLKVPLTVTFTRTDP